MVFLFRRTLAGFLLIPLVILACGGESTTGQPAFTGDAADIAGDVAADDNGGSEFVIPSKDANGSQLPDFGGSDMADHCAEEPGSAGCPCLGNADCLSGYCVAATGGSVCTLECLEECPFDWTCTGILGFGADLVFLCIPEPQALCGGGRAQGLLSSCSATWPPDPEPGEAFVACYGFQECTASGWSDCMLPDEVCDNQDNNCDGLVDEDFVNAAGLYHTAEHCGQCNNNCTFLKFPNADTVCDTKAKMPTCAMQCLKGFFDLNHNPEDGCECEFLSGTDYPDGVDQNCDGADGDIGEALFVAKNGDDGNSGAIDEPMLTIQAALDKAFAAGKRDVYVATGVYAASVELREGVGLYGGYSSDFLKRAVALNVTVIMGEEYAPDMPGAVNAVGIGGDSGTTVLDGFTIFGHNNMDPGGSSYAVHISDCGDALRLSDNTIEAGSAGPGDKGADGLNGAAGKPAGDGAGAFGVGTGNCGSVVPEFPRPGGVGGEGVCETGDGANGGQGGGNTCPATFGAAPVEYENGAQGAGPEGGLGGPGGFDREVWFCILFPPDGECHQAEGGNETGHHGFSGADGVSGETPGGNSCAALQGAGQVEDGLWVGSAGLAGELGQNGSGGGGGGAGGGAQNASGCNGRTHVGGTGGGGGSGGCGGTGGEGGGAGGASFGVFMSWSEEPATVPTISGNAIIGGTGGAGGQGGNAGSGGPGGQGGLGGAEDFGNAPCAAPGGNGGDGGLGGHGEGGGGGCGGASFCLFAHGAGSADLQSYKTENTFTVGAGGAGGSGGPSIGHPGDTGADGESGEVNY